MPWGNRWGSGAFMSPGPQTNTSAYDAQRNKAVAGLANTMSSFGLGVDGGLTGGAATTPQRTAGMMGGAVPPASGLHGSGGPIQPPMQAPIVSGGAPTAALPGIDRTPPAPGYPSTPTGAQRLGGPGMDVLANSGSLAMPNTAPTVLPQAYNSLAGAMAQAQQAVPDGYDWRVNALNLVDPNAWVDPNNAGRLKDLPLRG